MREAKGAAAACPLYMTLGEREDLTMSGVAALVQNSVAAGVGLQQCLQIAGETPVGPCEGEVRTANVREDSWCARRRGCSPSGTVRMCSFWISSMLPMAMLPSLLSARLSGKLLLLKEDMKFTCAAEQVSGRFSYSTKASR